MPKIKIVNTSDEKLFVDHQAVGEWIEPGGEVEVEFTGATSVHAHVEPPETLPFDVVDHPHAVKPADVE